MSYLQTVLPSGGYYRFILLRYRTDASRIMLQVARKPPLSPTHAEYTCYRAAKLFQLRPSPRSFFSIRCISLLLYPPLKPLIFITAYILIQSIAAFYSTHILDKYAIYIKETGLDV